MALQIKYSYSVADPVTREFLTEMGLSQTQIDQGYVTDSDFLDKKINPLFLRELALSEEGVSDRFIQYLTEDVHAVEDMLLPVDFSPEEMAWGLKLWKELPVHLRASMFFSDYCTHPETGKILYNNLTSTQTADVSDELVYNLSKGVVVEDACTESRFLADGVLEEELKGIHFNPQNSDRNISQAAKAVVPVVSTWLQGEPFVDDELAHGSAILISAQGHVATAAHMLFSEDGEFADDAYLILGSGFFSIRQEHLLYADAENDVALLKIPGLEKIKNMQWAKLAETLPQNGDWLTAVGYPKLQDEEARGITLQAMTRGNFMNVKAFSTAITKSPELLDLEDPTLELEPFYLTSVPIVPGYSGGGYFDDAGRLVGVSSSIYVSSEASDPDLEGYITFVSPLLKEDVADPQLVKVLEEIETAQAGKLKYAALKLRRSAFLHSLKSFLGLSSSEAK